MELTKQQIQDYVLRLADEECAVEEGEEAWVEANVKLLVEGDTITEHKSAYNTNIYKAGDYYFDVTFMRDNSGYWGSFRYPTEICEVKPVEVTVTKYVPV